MTFQFQLRDPQDFKGGVWLSFLFPNGVPQDLNWRVLDVLSISKGAYLNVSRNPTDPLNLIEIWGGATKTWRKTCRNLHFTNEWNPDDPFEIQRGPMQSKKPSLWNWNKTRGCLLKLKEPPQESHLWNEREIRESTSNNWTKLKSQGTIEEPITLFKKCYVTF